MDDRLESNKRTIMEVYGLTFNQSQPHEAIEPYAGETYTQQNPYVADGNEAFIAYRRGLVIKANIGQESTFSASRKMARLLHWDVLQVVPDNPANSNTMFLMLAATR